MARIIQDSEDEEDFVVTSPAGTPSPGNSQTRKGEPPTTRTKSTSETDILRREIYNAQQQLISPSLNTATNISSEPRSNAHHPSTSPSHINANKRRKTSSATQNDTLQSQPIRRKSLKTYGSSNKKRNNNTFSSQNSIFEPVQEYRHYAIGNETMSISVDGNGIEHGIEKVWDLPPSIQDDFVQHNPTFMFPDMDASSTIPNNTFTQKRIIEEALSRNQVVPNTHPQTQASACSEFSIPWSDSTQGGKSQKHLKSSSTSKMEPVPHNSSTPARKARSKTSLTPIATAHTPSGSPVNANQRKSTTPELKHSTKLLRSKTVGESRTRRSSIAESVDEISLADPAVIKISRSKSTKSRISTYSQDKGIPHLKASAQQDVLTLKGHGSVESQPNDVEPQLQQCMAGVPSLFKTHKQGAGENSLDIDEFASGLPDENYKPRPSRSRSSHLVQEDAIDHSKRSEQPVRGKGKRRKTTNDDIHSTALMSASEKIKAIGNMGFSPSKALLALSASSGNVEQAIDRLVAQSTIDLSPKNQRVPASRSCFVGVEISSFKTGPEFASIHDGIPEINILSKDQVEEVIAHEESVPSPVALIKLTSDEIETEILDHPMESLIHEITADAATIIEDEEMTPSKNPNSKRRKSSKNQRAAEDDFTVGEQPNEQPQEKKRGRGRPRKNIEIPASIRPIDDVVKPLDASHLVNEGDILSVASPLKEVAPNIHPLITKVNSDDNDENYVLLSNSPEAKPPASTPENKPIIKTAVEHSPLSKGKVPYRIGLSKRARIAPLLRTVKK